MSNITELKNTVELMSSSDYKDRFRAEYFQLKIRGDALEKFLEKYKNDELSFKPDCSYDLLMGQLKAMSMYMSYLLDRAEIEGIEFGDE